MVTTKTAQPKSKRQLGKEKGAQYLQQFSGLDLWGEIITTVPGTNNTYPKVVEALKAAGLDEGAAKELTPRSAWTRATKHLSAERVIDVVREDEDEAVFQLTKKVLGTNGHTDPEMLFQKETYVRLNKTTGKVSCKVPKLQETAQALLDKCLEARTGADITRICTLLFEERLGELVHFDSGVYFVPNEYSGFTAQMDNFLRALGGRVNRWPVPKGTPQGDRSVQEGVASHFERLIADYNQAVEDFDVATRRSTVESMAQKINGLRGKIEAYSMYLREKAEELLPVVQQGQEKLKAKVLALSRERKALPADQLPRAPGVIAVIIDRLRMASKEAPITKAQMLEHLQREFPSRDPKGMKQTVNVQLPGGLKRSGHKIESSGDGVQGRAFWIETD